MGTVSSVSDDRPQSQTRMEQRLGVQLMIPVSAACIPNVKLLAVGTFINGEFHQVEDLTVNDLYSCRVIETKITTHSHKKVVENITDGTTTTSVHIFDNWKTYEVDTLEVDRAIIGSVMKFSDLRLYNLGSKLYVVRAVHTASNFDIKCKNPGYDRGNNCTSDMNIEDVWGYQLVRYKISISGIVSRDHTFGKVC